VATGKPVVALESTIYTHGFPYPESVALASLLESVVRVNGGIPATIGILNGVARVGLSAEELIELASTAEKKDALKVSRRDLGYICGLGMAGRRLHGGTTVSGTMVLAHLAGIKVFGTGGLGGVHRGGESSMDISADLTELGRTPVAVVSSGCKSFLDIPRTLEFLETEGVCVGTFADGREGTVDFPAFFSRDSGIKSPRVIRDEAEAAAIIYAQSRLPVNSGIHFANPVPAEQSIPRGEMDTIIEEAIRLAEVEGYRGSDNTPFVLAKIKELSGGKSVIANRALVEANVKRATKVAVELSKLEQADRGTGGR
jgi:pseudouridine-5'-phosphate glycosidase/pseudouridine kinase